MEKSTPISYLRENDVSNLIIGVVITAEKPNLIPDKFGKKTFSFFFLWHSFVEIKLSLLIKIDSFLWCKASNPAQKRYALNFCLRDEKKDTINATVWGNMEYVNPLASVCRIGKQGNYIWV
jgi:hypothetical protein